MIDGDGAEHGTVLVVVGERVICHSGIMPDGCCIVLSAICTKYFK